MNLLSSVFGYARRDWGWISVSPLANVRRPPAARHRKRTINPSEIRRLMRAMGYRTGAAPASKTACVAYALLLGLQTGMRAGEICGMQWANMHASWVTLPETKNGDARRRSATRALALARGRGGNHAAARAHGRAAGRRTCGHQRFGWSARNRWCSRSGRRQANSHSWPVSRARERMPGMVRGSTSVTARARDYFSGGRSRSPQRAAAGPETHEQNGGEDMTNASRRRRNRRDKRDPWPQPEDWK